MRYSISDYSIRADRKGWGPGWPTPRWSDMASVKATRSGVTINVHRRIARLVQVLLDETERRGYLLRGGQTGAYNSRPISGTTVPSNHSWGLAIDVNWSINFASYDGRNHGDLPAWVPDLWAQYGFAWGGHYSGSFKDPMHLEFMGSPADADDMTALAVDQIRNTATEAATEEDELDATQSGQLKDAERHAEHADRVVSTHLAPLRAEVGAGFAAIGSVLKQIATAGGGQVVIDMDAVEAAARQGAEDALSNIRLVADDEGDGGNGSAS